MDEEQRRRRSSEKQLRPMFRMYRRDRSPDDTDPNNIDEEPVEPATIDEEAVEEEFKELEEEVEQDVQKHMELLRDEAAENDCEDGEER